MEFVVGLVVIPAVMVCVGVVVRARRGSSDLSPGSKAARRLGCVCSRRRNLWGHREALSGVCEVTAGCPVLMHHPDRRRAMYNCGD